MDWTWGPSIPHPETLYLLSTLIVSTHCPHNRVETGSSADRLLSALRYSHLQMTVLLIWEGRDKKQGPFSETINMFENIQTSVYLVYLSKLFCLLLAFQNIYAVWEKEKKILIIYAKKKKRWPESSAFEKPKFKLLNLKIIVSILAFKKNIFKNPQISPFLSWTSTRSIYPEENNTRIFQLYRLWEILNRCIFQCLGYRKFNTGN